MTKALFLDRDGVINKEVEYLYRQDDFVFIEGVFEACLFYKRKGYKIFVITNQAGIARGYYTESDFLIINKWMLECFDENGIKISKVYYCPHHPEYSGECSCRKPKTGMIDKAVDEYQIDLNSSILVGDKETDIIAGIRAGIGRNVLVRSGHKIDEKNTLADIVIDSIKDLMYL